MSGRFLTSYMNGLNCCQAGFRLAFSSVNQLTLTVRGVRSVFHGNLALEVRDGFLTLLKAIVKVCHESFYKL